MSRRHVAAIAVALLVAITFLVLRIAHLGVPFL